jgi:hypothetical protein
MIRNPASSSTRALKSVTLAADLVVAGGGVAGVCAAVTAARAGIRVILAQDRPVLGGNASSEVRLWMLGATSHMGNNNRWAREGGLVDEILVENLYRNPEGNPLILDTILLEKVLAESQITLLLNTAVDSVEKTVDSTISTVSAFCSQNQTRYRLEAPLFCDASGDGIVAFLAGAPFRMGAESRDEFGEGFAPERAYGELLGHSLYFYSKDVGRPVRYVAPEFALKDITRIPRYHDVRASDSGCRFWWFEYGGRMDTVHDTEEIKWELWKVVYGVWDYIKNSGKFPEAENLTLEWVGAIPGKRESRRFEGDYILNQRDLVEQRTHPDAISFGGWAMDLHPADGVYSELSPCTQWHSKGVYQVPYRCLYSRSIDNLFLGGRIMSVSHVAFGSTRVMATCGHNAQAIGMAAAICRESGFLPRDLVDPARVRQLQQRLLRSGQYIPGVALDRESGVRVSASSRLILRELVPDGSTLPLDTSRAMLLPVPAGPLPCATFLVDVESPAVLELQVRGSSVPGNFTPDVVLHHETLTLQPGPHQSVTVQPRVSLAQPAYLAYCLLRNPDVHVHTSAFRASGILSLSQSMNRAVAKGARQEPPEGSGIDTFEFWLPSRRPEGRNFAVVLNPPLDVFAPENVQNGIARPTCQPNVWIADPGDPSPRLSLCWGAPRTIRRIELSFDTDFDHPMESVLMGHPEREIPFCVKRYRITAHDGRLLFESAENHQTRNIIVLPEPVSAASIHIDILEARTAPAAVFGVRCYED